MLAKYVVNFKVCPIDWLLIGLVVWMCKYLVKKFPRKSEKNNQK